MNAPGEPRSEQGDSTLARLRRVYNAGVIAIREVHSDLRILHIAPDAGVPPHVAGQYATLGLGVWESSLTAERVAGDVESDRLIKRPYSLSSSILNDRGELIAAHEETSIEVYLVLVREADPDVPSLPGRLFALERNDRLWMAPEIPGSYTLLGVPNDAPVLLVSTGTGEAPHNKMILELLREQHTGPIASVVSVRYGRDLGYLEVHRALEARFPSYRYVPLVTREGSNRERIQDLIESPRLAERIGFDLDPRSSHIFVCGNPSMVKQVIELVARRGFSVEAGNLHREGYW